LYFITFLMKVVKYNPASREITASLYELLVLGLFYEIIAQCPAFQGSESSLSMYSTISKSLAEGLEKKLMGMGTLGLHFS